jgi:hypothetical protein
MDQATQQNSALVEEMAAAATNLKSQASELVQAVAAFKLTEGEMGAGLPRTSVRSPAASAKPFKGAERRLENTPFKPAAAKPSAAPRPSSAVAAKPALVAAAPKTQSKPAPAGGDDDWETF